MRKSSDSLGGKNIGSRPESARSSRARSTLHKKLRTLDSNISKLDRAIGFADTYHGFGLLSAKDIIALAKSKARRMEMDGKRRDIRLKLKARTS